MPSSSLLSKLQNEHLRLIAAARAIEAFVAGPHPSTVDGLAALRWTFTREMLLHFAHVETMVLQPLAADLRPEVAAQAARSCQDLYRVYQQFTRHAGRWHGLPAAERWEEYRQAIALLMRLIRVRLAAQERDIYPLLPAQPGGERVAAACAPVNYAAEAWKIRGLIYSDREQSAIA